MTEREKFEAHYAIKWNEAYENKTSHTAAEVAELREGDGYGEDRTYLNAMWEGWQAALESRVLAERKFECAARKQGSVGGNAPADCDWPGCGCDDYANKVIGALEESGAFTHPTPDDTRLKNARKIVRQELGQAEHELNVDAIMSLRRVLHYLDMEIAD